MYHIQNSRTNIVIYILGEFKNCIIVPYEIPYLIATYIFKLWWQAIVKLINYTFGCYTKNAGGSSYCRRIW